MAEKPMLTPVVTGQETAGMVSVTAPMDLQEGYQLQVSVNGQQKNVTVPAGGVKEGQSFQARPVAGASTGGVAAGGVVHNIPQGKWRDNICDCFKFGCCHAMCCLGFCCEPILGGQVMTRMSRDFMGGPGARPSASKTCQIVTGIFIVVAIVQGALRAVQGATNCPYGNQRYNDAGELYIQCPDGTTETPTSTFQIVGLVHAIVGFLFAVYFFFAICRTRAAIRRKYEIKPECCGEAEDCCCTFWCSCCTVQQMARHTNDYSTYDVGCCSGDCCNNRGQQPQVPEIEP
ncbi:expressed unknown protein [Seminavis robusta]|uniref:Uncharacterized protein n=1 Tax=Seminavis robusta TaxID=568900 RepID=A0A9N8DPL1_9STRA|nr:expressed unknown protein [Seminavis robusta]|eukprot:Sro279_g106920.1 n/a (288) ;mRNA; r:73756-74789